MSCLILFWKFVFTEVVCALFVCLILCMSCVLLNCVVIVFEWGLFYVVCAIAILFVCLCHLCSRSQGFVLLKCCFCVLHGCSGYWYACHLVFLWLRACVCVRVCVCGCVCVCVCPNCLITPNCLRTPKNNTTTGRRRTRYMKWFIWTINKKVNFETCPCTASSGAVWNPRSTFKMRLDSGRMPCRAQRLQNKMAAAGTAGGC